MKTKNPFASIINYMSHYDDVNLTTFVEVVFVKDFGPYKAGDYVSAMSINFETGIIETYAADHEYILYRIGFELKFDGRVEAVNARLDPETEPDEDDEPQM